MARAESPINRVFSKPYANALAALLDICIVVMDGCHLLGFILQVLDLELCLSISPAVWVLKVTQQQHFLRTEKQSMVSLGQGPMLHPPASGTSQVKHQMQPKYDFAEIWQAELHLVCNAAAAASWHMSLMLADRSSQPLRHGH